MGKEACLLRNDMYNITRIAAQYLHVQSMGYQQRAFRDINYIVRLYKLEQDYSQVSSLRKIVAYQESVLERKAVVQQQQKQSIFQALPCVSHENN